MRVMSSVPLRIISKITAIRTAATKIPKMKNYSNLSKKRKPCCCICMQPVKDFMTGTSISKMNGRIGQTGRQQKKTGLLWKKKRHERIIIPEWQNDFLTDAFMQTMRASGLTETETRKEKCYDKERIRNLHTQKISTRT